MPMREKTYICVAAIAGAHGVRGEVKIKSFTETPADCFSYGTLRGADGAPILTLKSYRPVGRYFALSAPEVTTREQAQSMKSTKLYVERSALPPANEDEFYYSDLVGLEVKTVDGKRVGHIKAVHDFGAGDMLEIKPMSGASFFHPFTKLSVPKIDLAKGRVIIVRLNNDDD